MAGGWHRDWAPPRRVRHVWLKLDGQLSPPVQAYVLDWQRRGRDWWALVMYAMDTATGGTIYLQQWCELRRLTPVPSDPNMVDQERRERPSTERRRH